MALSDRITTRLSTARLVGLTNPDAPQATATVDSTRLAAACADAEAEFEAVCGVAYDDTDARHQAVAVIAAEWKLIYWQGQHADVADRVRDEFLAAAERLALTRGGRSRILPQTSSQLTPSDEAPNGLTVRPDFDRQGMGNLLRQPRAPTPRNPLAEE